MPRARLTAAEDRLARYGDAMGTDHDWAQRHLSHYVEGDLRPGQRRRLDRHALGCTDCGRGLASMRALVAAARSLGGPPGIAPGGMFDRVRQASGAAAPPGA